MTLGQQIQRSSLRHCGGGTWTFALRSPGEAIRSTSCEHLPLLTAEKGWPGVARALLRARTQGCSQRDSIRYRNVQHKPKHHFSNFIGAARGGSVHLYSDRQHPLELAYNPESRTQNINEPPSWDLSSPPTSALGLGTPRAMG